MMQHFWMLHQKKSLDTATINDATLLDASPIDATETDTRVIKTPEGDGRNKKVELIVYKTDEQYYYVDKDAFYDTDQIYTNSGECPLKELI